MGMSKDFYHEDINRLGNHNWHDLDERERNERYVTHPDPDALADLSLKWMLTVITATPEEFREFKAECEEIGASTANVSEWIKNYVDARYKDLEEGIGF